MVKRLLLSLALFCVPFGAFASTYTGNPSAESTIHNTDTTFTNVRNNGAGDSTYPNGSTHAEVTVLGRNDPLYVITRSLFCFDTSSLTSGASISAATITIYVTSHTNFYNDSNGYLAVVGAVPSDPASLVLGDFSKIPSQSAIPTEFSDEKTIAGMTDNATKVFTLNSNGIASISKTGTTCLGLREGHDINDNTISVTGSTQFNQVVFNDVSAGSNEPLLTITYTVSGGGSSSSSSTSSLTASGGIMGSGSLILFHTLCNSFAGTGANSTCTQADTSVEIPAIHAFTQEFSLTGVELMTQGGRWLFMAGIFFLMARWLFRILTHFRPVSRYRR